ncbi:MAG TPA: hypothetical protein VGN21_03525 [Stellaceae bacterium]|jgi:hypothetical protein
MSAELAEEYRQLQELVSKVVDRELTPLEPRIIDREIRGEHPSLSLEDKKGLASHLEKRGPTFPPAPPI